MQILCMTSDKSQDKVLPGFAYLFNKYYSKNQKVVICGFTPPKSPLPPNFELYRIGNYSDYPKNLWSNALMRVLNDVADERFVLLLDDYWITRKVDMRGMEIIRDYMEQFQYTLKVDLGFDRLYNQPGRYDYGYNTYGTAGHLDLIRSRPGSSYQMSLWGGMWNRDQMKRFIIPRETAQQVEMRGTERVNLFGSSVLVLGTRQGPLLHGNILRDNQSGSKYKDGGWEISMGDIDTMREMGLLVGLEG